MKNRAILAIVLLVLVPACGPWRRQTDGQAGRKSTTRAGQVNANTYELNELDEFVLEEDDSGSLFETGTPITCEELEEVITSGQEGLIVQFDYDSSQIKESELAKIKQNAQRIRVALRKDKKALCLVEGHSCRIALNPDYNYVLSCERAHVVGDTYASLGVPRERMKVVGRGATQLLTEQEGERAQSINRRVETQVVKTR